jgi:hypothetical protein
MSRYRSVRRAQEQQHHPHQMPSPHAQQNPPPMPAVADMHARNEPSHAPAPTSAIGRSMSRYHRRPRAADPTPTGPGAPPLRSNTLPQPPPPPLPQTGLPPPLRSNTLPQPPPLPQNALPPSSPVRNRALNTPQELPSSANHAQPRPRTAKHRADTAPPLPRDAHQQQQKHDDPRVLLQRERERQRLMKERLEAEAHAEKEAKRAEVERQEMLRLEQEEAARLQAQREAEEAEALRRQKEEQKAEKERGKRLRKAETQQVVQQRAEEERRAKLEEKERKAQLNDKPRTSHSTSSTSSPMSPPRHDGGFGIFKRRKDEGLSLEEAREQARPRTARQTSGDDRDLDTIRPGGGGAVLGIDAPTSAVNGGDRVRMMAVV